LNKENDLLDNELEYNDGLGDMLREKESLQFSWTKTLTTALAILVVILLVLVLFFTLTRKKDATLQEVFLEDIPVDVVELTPPVAVTEEKVSSKEVEAEIEKIRTQLKINKKSEKEVVTQPVKVVAQEVKPVEKFSTSYVYKVIAGSFANYENASAQQSLLAKKKISSFIRKHKTKNNKILFQVQVGAFQGHKEALTHSKAMNKKGVTNYIVRY
jgi:cell division septation protein DedD